MTSFWTARADNRLLTEWGRGRSDAEIARILGARPGAVAARLKELRAYLRRSDVEDFRRANVMRAEAARARTEARFRTERKLIADMAKAIKRGMPRGQAMLRAYKAGATWRVIGEHFGVGPAAAYAAARAWTRRREIAQENRARKEARADLQRRLIADMAKAVARGMPAEQAMARARRAGASWRNIGAYFGIGQSAAFYRARTWMKHRRPVRPYHPRAGQCAFQRGSPTTMPRARCARD